MSTESRALDVDAFMLLVDEYSAQRFSSYRAGRAEQRDEARTKSVKLRAEVEAAYAEALSR